METTTRKCAHRYYRETRVWDAQRNQPTSKIEARCSDCGEHLFDKWDHKAHNE